MAYRYSELILFKLTCPSAKCGNSFAEVIGQLSGRDSIPCPQCGTSIDLKSHKAVLQDLMRVAAELDKLDGSRK